MLKLVGYWAVLLSVPVGSGCIERRAVGDPEQRVDDAQMSDGQVMLDQGRTSDGSLPDARPSPLDGRVDVPPPVDGSVVDAMPPPVDAATVPTDCVLPEAPPRDCSPDAWALGDAPALPFQSVGVDSQFDPEYVELGDGCAFDILLGQREFASEAEFQAAVVCQDGFEAVASTVDWSASRLVVLGAIDGLGEIIWAVTQMEETHVGVDLGGRCSGVPPRGGFVAALIPADAPPLGQALECLPDLGPHGCCSCEVICDPEPRVGECICPP